MAILDQALTNLKRRARPGDARAGGGVFDVEPDGYIPFKLRFLAWWEGVDPEDLLVSSGEGAERPGSPAALVIDQDAHDAAAQDVGGRIDLWRRLWGEGYHLPGGDSLTRALVGPCDLGDSGRALELNSGLGGAARSIARDTGAVVTGFETREELAAAANAANAAEGLADSVAVELCDLSGLSLPRGEYNAILARELLYRTGDKSNMLKAFREALKLRGHLVLIDYVLLDEGPPEPELTAWRKIEPIAPYPWTKEQYRQAMSEFGFEVQTFDDVTKTYCDLVLEAWSGLTRALNTAEIDRAFANVMLVEGELWQKRVRAMQSGRLCVLHIHALKKETSTLSEW